MKNNLIQQINDNVVSALPSITFKNVGFCFEDERILTDFSFSAPPGQHTVLKGESGSGKSTILKLLLGFYKPDSGTIQFDRDDTSLNNIRLQTAWLPQDLNLGAGSVDEVTQKPFEFAANRSVKQNNFDRTRIKIFKTLGLSSDILTKQFRDLSTGQRQRIGLTICSLLDKPLILLDEPTSALDRVSKQKAAELLLTKKRTIISTSHDPYWVDKADNIIDL